MRTLILTVVLLIMTAGCSTKRPDDAWRYNTATAYKYAEQYFLEDKTALAKSEYNQAESYAKQSADLTPLTRLYLSKCALNRSVLLEDACDEYQSIAHHSDDPSLSSYFALLNQNVRQEEISALPSQYRSFAKAYLAKNRHAIQKSIADIEPLTSQMIAASTARSYLDDMTIEMIIERASYFGYKRAVIAWMQQLIDTTDDDKKAALLKQKLSVLR
ncbi:MAG: hypothetical protein U9Q62_02835 [Campylobacterota bacterium]|nr:hypothetical protein [Campylobacterota bacterium]